MKVSRLFLKAINKIELNNKGGKIQKCQTSTIFRSDTPRKVKSKENGRNINSNFISYNEEKQPATVTTSGGGNYCCVPKCKIDSTKLKIMSDPMPLLFVFVFVFFPLS